VTRVQRSVSKIDRPCTGQIASGITHRNNRW